MLISEIKNDLPQIKPVKEIMSIYILMELIQTSPIETDLYMH